jgi:alpha-tubulin suppressor-like RCC1 family protein
MSTAVPSMVPGVSEVSAIAAGNADTCALRLDGSVICWGADSVGQIGSGEMPAAWVAPPRSSVSGFGPGSRRVESIFMGYAHACALASDDGVYCWGANDHGQIGVPDTSVAVCDSSPDGGFADVVTSEAGSPTRTPCSPNPVQVFMNNGQPLQAAQIAVGLSFTCARRADGSVWCWGANESGQLGDGSTVSSNVPVQVTGLLTNGVPDVVMDIAAGSRHACAIVNSNGIVKCWGSNSDGQLGPEPSGASPPLHPYVVQGIPPTPDHVVAGDLNSCVHLSDGRIYCWGANQLGQLGIGDLSVRQSPTPRQVLIQ